MGFRESGLARLGTYVVDRRAGSEPPRRMIVKATPADMAGTIRAPKTRAWKAMTLDAIVASIAGEAGLKPVVSDRIKSTFYPLVAQTSESDLHLLSRLARVLDATAKPADGRLLVLQRGKGLTVTGEEIEPLRLLRRDWASIEWALGERGKYGAVAAEWTDIATGQLRLFTAGSEAPRLKMRHPFSSEDEARRAAGLVF